DDAVGDDGVVENAAVGNDRMINLRAVDFRAGQKARPAEDGGGHVEKVEARQFIGDIEVGLEEGADGADVFPVALEERGEDAQAWDDLGNSSFAEIGQGVVEQSSDHLAAEDVDAYGGQKQLAVDTDAQQAILLRG